MKTRIAAWTMFVVCVRVSIGYGQGRTVRRSLSSRDRDGGQNSGTTAGTVTIAQPVAGRIVTGAVESDPPAPCRLQCVAL